MIVNRRTWFVKLGQIAEAVELIKAESERTGSTPRIYTPYIGTFNEMALEFEFESLAEYEKFWSEYSASPEAAAFSEKFSRLIERGNKNEIWTLAG